MPVWSSYNLEDLTSHTFHKQKNDTSDFRTHITVEFRIVYSFRDSSTALDLSSECNFSFSTTTTLIRCFIPCSSSWNHTHTEINHNPSESAKNITTHKFVHIPCTIWPQLPGAGCTPTGCESLGPNPEKQASWIFPPAVLANRWKKRVKQNTGMASKILRKLNYLPHLTIQTVT